MCYKVSVFLYLPSYIYYMTLHTISCQSVTCIMSNIWLGLDVSTLTSMILQLYHFVGMTGNKENHLNVKKIKVIIFAFLILVHQENRDQK